MLSAFEDAATWALPRKHFSLNHKSLIELVRICANENFNAVRSDVQDWNVRTKNALLKKSGAISKGVGVYCLNRATGWNASNVCGADKMFTSKFQPEFMAFAAAIGLNTDAIGADRQWTTQLGMLSFMIEFLNSTNEFFFYLQEKGSMRKPAQDIVDEMFKPPSDDVLVAFPYATLLNIFSGYRGPAFKRALTDIPTWLKKTDTSTYGQCKFNDVPDITNFGAVAVIMRRSLVKEVVVNITTGGARYKPDDNVLMDIFRELNVTARVAYPQSRAKWRDTRMQVVTETEFISYDAGAISTSHNRSFADLYDGLP